MHDFETPDSSLDRRLDADVIAGSATGEAEAGEAAGARADARLARWAVECVGEEAGARSLLGRLWEGDPLQIARRCARRISERALLLEPAQVERRARARIALTASLTAARGARGDLAGADWIAEGVDQAIDDLLDADARGAARDAAECLVFSGVPSGGDNSGSDSLLAVILCDTLGIEPASVARACAAFNVLPATTRSVFYAAVIEGESIERCARRVAAASDEDRRETVWRRLARAFRAMGSLAGAPANGAEAALGEANAPGTREEPTA
ncbi:MAG: hypothetical protein CMJ84_16520 [Planctomycetes bacterium]|jgi:hypothetical protein|nr:hypothetical protein [Planctomycetota bacterium]MDP6409952.1 hypothetical protein [Planctomycetota bacterium]